MPKARIPTAHFLANLPLFRELDSADMAQLAASVAEIELPRGTLIFRRGTPCRGFHVVVYGQVKLALQGPQGGEKVVELMGPGQSFGEAVMFLEKPYMVSAECLVDSKLLHVPREAVFAEIDRDPRFARRMLAGLSRRLHHLIADLEAVSLHSGTQRVIGYLLSQPDEGGDGEARNITLPTRKGIIASRLNVTQEHFSRILHGLVAAGLITVEGRTVRVPDVGRLRAHGV
ncbi:MAG: Crp/Fnr family transcriptional regulator [Burkholderiales bacterium]|nr:Crp/Fnr family transcriptional regulator [Burkholderiales bacterium]